MKDKPNTPLVRYRIGSGETLQELSARLGVNKSTVMRWENGRVPADRLAEVERITGIPRYILRPDIFMPPQPEAAE